MKWSTDTINKIRDAHDIVDWIGRDTVLKAQSGGQYSGLCPFPDHKEKTPSFSVSASKQVYHCFGCQKGGDIFTYFRDQKGMGFYEAVKYLADQAGIALKTSKDSRTDVVERNSLFRVNEKAAHFFHEKLLKISETHPVKQYLKKRGYSQEIIKTFRLGYAPPSNGLSTVFDKKEQELALKLGLFSKNNQGYFEMFRNRLMFPIISPMNQVLGFGGRTLGSAQPKYINSRDSDSFQKGRIFYGLKEATPYIRQKGYILIVEGYTDFLTLFQNGFQNVVATLGVALTSHHTRLLKRHTDKVILFFDGDSAGKQAAIRSLPLLLSAGLRIQRAELNGMDPDECLKTKGKDFLKNVLSHSRDLFLDVFFTRLQSLQGVEKLDLVREIGPVLSSAKDPVIKEYYTRKIEDVFLPSEQKAVKIALDTKAPKVYKKEISSKTIEQDESFIHTIFSLKNLPRTELYLLVLALSKREYLEYIISNINLKWLSHAEPLFKLIFNNYSQNPSNFDKLTAQLSTWVEPAGLLQTGSYPVLMDLEESSGKKFIQDCLSCLSLNYERAKLKNRVMQVKLKQGNVKEDLKDIQEMKKNILSMERNYEKQITK
ncbi:MAG: DNA primase [Bdellovibrionales bacterium]|nr:DNA primase [Bdellovibrionales bacterium]